MTRLKLQVLVLVLGLGGRPGSGETGRRKPAAVAKTGPGARVPGFPLPIMPGSRVGSNWNPIRRQLGSAGRSSDLNTSLFQVVTCCSLRNCEIVRTLKNQSARPAPQARTQLTARPRCRSVTSVVFIVHGEAGNPKDAWSPQRHEWARLTQCSSAETTGNRPS